MQRYAAWKAADIRKALREGRTPTAGPPADSSDAKAEADLRAEADLLDDLGLPSVPGNSPAIRVPSSSSFQACLPVSLHAFLGCSELQVII